MSIATEIARLQDAKGAIKTAIEGKGVTVPTETLLGGYASLIGSIATGGGLPSGISKLDSGTFTPTTDTSSWTASHNLQVAADFFYVFDTADLSLTANAIVNRIIWALGYKKTYMTYPSSGVVAYGRVYHGAYISSAVGVMEKALTTTAMRDAVFQSTNCDLSIGSSTFKFVAGHTYRWIAGVFA